MKKIVSAFFIFIILIIFTAGIIFTTEILWRSFGPVASEGALIDVAMFPYKHYLVSTHPANLNLGKSNHILEKYFAKGECVGPDNVTARFNSEGFRTHEFKDLPSKEKNEIRVIITGASVAISWNIGEACTLDSQLYRLFQAKYPNKKIRIFNLGNGAWKSFQELLALQLYGLKLDPDIIIAFDGYNDIQHAFSVPIEQPYSNNAAIAFTRYQNWIEGRVLELFTSLKIVEALKQKAYFVVTKVRNTKTSMQGGAPQFAETAKPGKLATLLEYPLNLKTISQRKDFDPYNQQAVDFYLQNEHLMAKTAQIKNAKIIFALAPTLYLKTPLSSEERKTLDKYSDSVNFVVQGYLRIRTGLKQIAQEESNASFFDMSNIFINNPDTIFSDSGHFNKKGYEIVAEQLFNKIEDTLDLKSTGQKVQD